MKTRIDESHKRSLGGSATSSKGVTSEDRAQLTYQLTGHGFHMVTMPGLTTCDRYWFVESDLGLPYQDGKANIIPTGECKLVPHG